MTRHCRRARVLDIIHTKLGDFKGVLQNINDTSEINYNDTTANKPRTVFFYINNAPFALKPVGTDETQFELFNPKYRNPPAQDIYAAALNAMFNGENTLKFV